MGQDKAESFLTLPCLGPKLMRGERMGLFFGLKKENLLSNTFYFAAAIEKGEIFSVGPQGEEILIMWTVRVS